MNKTLLRILLPVLILASVLVFSLALSPLTTSSAHPAATARPQAQTPTPTPTAEDRSQPGSTDGPVVMSIAIAAIIILPILLHRALWAR